MCGLNSFIFMITAIYESQISSGKQHFGFVHLLNLPIKPALFPDFVDYISPNLPYANF